MAQQRTAAISPFSVDPVDELPVDVQLSWRLRALIASGRLAPGDRLPSFRQLAEWAEVNVNTVRAVYRRFEDEGLVVTRHGLGTFVADGVASAPELERIAAGALEEARVIGVSPRDLAIVAMVSATLPGGLDEGVPEAPIELPDPAITELPDPDAESDELTVRQELRRQIGRLEAELAAYVRELEPDPSTPRSQPEPHVARVEELEQVRDRLMEQLSQARRAAEERAAREERVRARREEMLRDPASHRWEVVSAEDAGEPGCVDYRVVPRYGPLGALMRWWQVKVSGGCPLAAPREAAGNGGR